MKIQLQRELLLANKQKRKIFPITIDNFISPINTILIPILHQNRLFPTEMLRLPALFFRAFDTSRQSQPSFHPPRCIF